MRKIYSLILIIVLFCSIVPNVWAEANVISAFSEISVDSVTEVNNLEVNSGVIGATYNGSWAEFDNIDFGDNGVGTLELKIGVPQNYAGATMTFHIDSLDSAKFAELTVASTGAFGTRIWQSAVVFDSDITGIHNLFIKYYTSGTGDLEAIRMTEYNPADAAPVPADMNGSGLEEEFGLLYALGAVEWDKMSAFEPSKKITAGEFIDAVVRLKAGDEDEKEKLITAFGMSADTSITNEQAVGVLDYILNRSEYKNALSENGYVFTAIDDFMINGASDKEITRADMLELLYQASEAEVFEFEKITYSDGKTYAQYAARENNTLLAHYRSIYSEDGIVTMDRFTGLESVSNLQENELLIDGYLFNAGECSITNLLGYEVKYYYIQGESENTLVYIERMSNSSNLVIDSDDIISYDNRVLTYEDENGKSKTQKIQKDVRIIYNGLAVSVYSEDLFDIECGNIEFIYRHDDLCCVRINSVTDYILTKCYDDILYFKDTDYKINLEDSSVEYDIVNKFGKEVETSLLIEGMVCSVAEAVSMDGALVYYTITVSQKSASGEISQIDAYEKTVKIGDKEYRLSKAMEDVKIKELSVGMSVKAYINAFDKVSFIEAGKSTEMLGYLISCYKDEDSEENMLRIFDETGAIKVYRCTEKLGIDDAKYKADAVLEQIKPNGVMRNELVLFKVNSQGAVSKMVFAKNNGSGDADNGLYKYFDGSGLFKSSTRSWGGRTILSGDFILFNIPKDKGDYDSYMVGKPSFYNDENVNMVTYNRESEKLNVTIGVKEYEPASPGNISSGQDIYYVSGITIELNSYDEPLYKLEFFNGTGKTKQSLFVAESASSAVQQLKVGDGVRFSQNNKNEIVELNRMFSAQDNEVYSGSTGFNAEVQIIKGTVYKTQDMLLQFEREREVFNYSSAAVYIYNSGKNALELGSTDDVLGYTSVGTDVQTVFVYAHRSGVRSIVVVK